MAEIRDIFSAIKQGDAAAIKRLLIEAPTRAHQEDARGVRPIMFALYYGKIDLARLVAAFHPDIDLFEAIALGDMTRFEALMVQDPSAVHLFSGDGFTPLHFAAFFGHEAIARELIAYGADVCAVARNEMCVHPLHSAVASRSRAVVMLLLDNHADVNAHQQNGYTPLMGAAAGGDEATVKLLLDHHEDPTLTSDKGETAHAIALAKGHEFLSSLLAV